MTAKVTALAWVQRIAADLGQDPAAAVEAGIRRGWVQRPCRPVAPAAVADSFAGPEYLHGCDRASEFLGISPEQVVRLVADGRLPVAGTRPSLGGEAEQVFALAVLRDYKRAAAQARSNPNPSGTGWVIGLRPAAALAGMSYAQLQRAAACGEIQFSFGEHGSMWFQKDALRALRTRRQEQEES